MINSSKITKSTNKENLQLKNRFETEKKEGGGGGGRAGAGGGA